MENDLEELEKQIKERKQEIANVPRQNQISSEVKSLSADTDAEYEKNKQEIAKTDNFKNLAMEITERATKAKFSKDMLDILDQEQKNAIQQFAYECLQEQFKLKQKHEKKLIKEQVKAQIQKKKYDILKDRYGYLYKEGEPFVPSKLHNKLKALTNWYEGTGNNFKKFVGVTLKILLFGGIGVLVAVLGFRILKYLGDLGKNLPM